MANRDEYAERAAMNWFRTTDRENAHVQLLAKVITKAYEPIPLHRKLARANGMIETMNESMKRLEDELARVTEERDVYRAKMLESQCTKAEALERTTRAEVERDLGQRALVFLARRGYKRCDIPACNCDSWHGGDFETRFREIADLLDTNGKTTLEAVRELIEERDRLRGQARDDHRRSMDRYPPEGTIGHLTRRRP